MSQKHISPFMYLDNAWETVRRYCLWNVTMDRQTAFLPRDNLKYVKGILSSPNPHLLHPIPITHLVLIAPLLTLVALVVCFGGPTD